MTNTTTQCKALADLASFLVWLEEDRPNGMWGHVETGRAVQALSEVTGLTMDQLVMVAHAGGRKNG
jgi:hypothetical protein